MQTLLQPWACPPSLYTAFGDKKQLFLEAVRLYVGELQVFARTVAEASSAYAAASELMTDAVIAYTGEETPRGRLLASAPASGSMASAEVRQAVAEVRRSVQRCLHDRIAQDVSRGLLPSTTDPIQLSCLVMAVMNGMSVLDVRHTGAVVFNPWQDDFKNFVISVG